MYEFVSITFIELRTIGMAMTPALRKLTLTAHVTASVGWIGALAVFLAHALASVVSQDEQVVRAMPIAMGLTAWFVILPLSLASLTTGLVQALGTAWGLFRHHWILFKLLLTAVATSVLLLKLEPISYLADAAAETTLSGADLTALRTSMVIHAAGGLSVLLAAVTLAVYKPRGMTRYGVRKQREQGSSKVGSDVGSATSTPLWVKVLGVIVTVLMLLVGLMLFGGGHGPGAHVSSGGQEGAPPAIPLRLIGAPRMTAFDGVAVPTRERRRDVSRTRRNCGRRFTHFSPCNCNARRDANDGGATRRAAKRTDE